MDMSGQKTSELWSSGESSLGQLGRISAHFPHLLDRGEKVAKHQWWIPLASPFGLPAFCLDAFPVLHHRGLPTRPRTARAGTPAEAQDGGCWGSDGFLNSKKAKRVSGVLAGRAGGRGLCRAEIERVTGGVWALCHSVFANKWHRSKNNQERRGFWWSLALKHLIFRFWLNYEIMIIWLNYGIITVKFEKHTWNGTPPWGLKSSNTKLLIITLFNL